MKFTANVDCTPEEARAFFGLPDVKPMQEEMMTMMSDKIKANMDSMDPESLLKFWMPAVNQSVEQFNSFLKTMMMTGSADNSRK